MTVLRGGIAMSCNGVGMLETMVARWQGGYVLEVSQHPTCLMVGSFLVLIVVGPSYVESGRHLWPCFTPVLLARLIVEIVL